MADQETTQQQPPKSSAAMIKFNEQGIQLQSFEDAFRFASAVARSGLAPRGMDTPEKILVAIQTGLEAGLTPMAALRGIVVVHGFPSWRGDMALALVRRSQMLDWIKEEALKNKDQRVIGWRVTTKRKDSKDSVTTEFTEERAKRAGNMGKDTYQKYPERMFRYRALGENLRDNFPDVLMGLASEHEVADYEQDLPPVKTVDGAVIPSPQLPPAAPDPLMQQLAGDLDALEQPPAVEPAPVPPAPQQSASPPTVDPAPTSPPAVPEDGPRRRGRPRKAPETPQPVAEVLPAPAHLPDLPPTAEEIEWHALQAQYAQDEVYLEMVKTWEWKALETAFLKHYPALPKNATTGMVAAGILKAKGRAPKAAKAPAPAPPPAPEEPETEVEVPSDEQWETMSKVQKVKKLASGIDTLKDVEILRNRAREALQQVEPNEACEILALYQMDNMCSINEIGQVHCRHLIREVAKRVGG